MNIPPAAARVESAAIVRRRAGIGGVTFALAGLLIYVAAGCWAISSALPYHDGALQGVTETLAAAAWLLGGKLAPILAFVGLALLVWSRLTFATPGVIAVDAAGLTLDRRHASEHVDPEDVLTGDHDAASGELTLRLTNGEIRARNVRRIEADALLSALAMGATDRALDLALLRRATVHRVVTAVLAIPLAGAAIHAASRSGSTAVVVATAAILGLAWAWLTLRVSSPTRLLVGHDGVALQGGRKPRFLPWNEVFSVSKVDGGIALFPVIGGVIIVELLPSRETDASRLTRLRRDHLVERIKRELESRSKAHVEALGTSQLDRGDRSFAAWRAALRDLVTRPSGGYRHSALDLDHLASVLWSRDVTPERRIGAALALAASDDPQARRRVRVFIDTCADDTLRDAVERAAEADLDDAELGRVLQRLERT
jgi:hypothetical protein